MSFRLRKILTPLLAVLGVQAWLLILNAIWGYNIQVEILGVALLASLLPPVNRLACKLLRPLHRPSLGMRLLTALAIIIAEAIYLAHFALTSRRALIPTMHDEYQFLLQARMVAHGRLWMPPHPLVDFFDTFYVLVTPKYAAQSFPGTAILYAPSIWLGVAGWKWSIGLAAIAVGLFYLVVTELAGGLAGLLAAGLLAKLSILRYVSTMVLAQTPVIVLGLAAMWAYLRWRRSEKHAIAWAGCVGFVGGLALITRPADALVFGLPVLAGIAIDLRRRGITSLAAMILAASPWLALQIIFNIGVTGHWLTTPFALYNQRDQPRLVYGLSIPPGDPRPMTRVPEKRAYYRYSVGPLLAEHKPSLFWHTFMQWRLPVVMAADLPQPMLIVLIPIGVLAWSRRRAWILASGLPLFFLIYTPYPIFARHYSIVAAPAAIFAAVVAPRAISLAWPKARAGAWTALSIFVVGVLCTKAVEDYTLTSSLAFQPLMLSQADKATAALADRGKPAVVLFRRNESVSNDAEPVYNIDTIWPDDALVIRAHDRRSENWKIFQYYATHGPDRAFYRFDEVHPFDGLTYLGMASALAKTRLGH
jgi:hypothetical protein